jgi:phage terminase small subunit
MATDDDPLTPKQRRFVEEYLVDLNGAQAAIRAGYSSDSAKEMAYENLTKPHVAEALREAQARLSKRTGLTAERVLDELQKLAFANMQDFMRVTSSGEPYIDVSLLTRDQAAALQEFTVEDYTEGRGDDARDVKRVRIKIADKRAALVDLGKHLGIFADITKHQQLDANGNPMTPVPTFVIFPDGGPGSDATSSKSNIETGTTSEVGTEPTPPAEAS